MGWKWVELGKISGAFRAGDRSGHHEGAQIMYAHDKDGHVKYIYIFAIRLFQEVTLSSFYQLPTCTWLAIEYTS